jgi:hypothetical protein
MKMSCLTEEGFERMRKRHVAAKLHEYGVSEPHNQDFGLSVPKGLMFDFIKYCKVRGSSPSDVIVGFMVECVHPFDPELAEEDEE